MFVITVDKITSEYFSMPTANFFDLLFKELKMETLKSKVLILKGKQDTIHKQCKGKLNNEMLEKQDFCQTNTFVTEKRERILSYCTFYVSYTRLLNEHVY